MVVGRRTLCAVLCLSAITVPLALEPSGLGDQRGSCSEGAVSRLYLRQTTPNGMETRFAQDSVLVTQAASFRCF